MTKDEFMKGLLKTIGGGEKLTEPRSLTPEAEKLYRAYLAEVTPHTDKLQELDEQMDEHKAICTRLHGKFGREVRKLMPELKDAETIKFDEKAMTFQMSLPDKLAGSVIRTPEWAKELAEQSDPTTTH